MQGSDLDRAYLRAIYRVLAPGGAIDLRIGEPSPALAALARGRPWALLTAWNPGSQPRPREENDAAQARLLAELAGCEVLPGEGRSQDGSWREESVLVLGMERPEAVALARRFGQRAIVAGRGEGPPELVSAAPR